MAAIIAPGFFSSSAAQLALAIGSIVAIVTAGVGVFTVIRGQSFAGEALSDTGIAGGSSAYLAGVSSLFGFVASSMLAAGAMELVGIQRLRGRDLATGIVLGFSFGVGALLLYFGSVYKNTTGATITILFGSIFTLSPSDLPLVAILGALALGTIAVLYRPLLLASTSPELAAARGIRLRPIGSLYLAAMALAVALSAYTVGAILSTAMLVGPAATALRLTRRPGQAILAAAAIGVGCVLGGVLLAYDSYDWRPIHHGWPASFFIVALILASYIASGPLAGRFPKQR